METRQDAKKAKKKPKKKEKKRKLEASGQRLEQGQKPMSPPCKKGKQTSVPKECNLCHKSLPCSVQSGSLVLGTVAIVVLVVPLLPIQCVLLVVYNLNMSNPPCQRFVPTNQSAHGARLKIQDSTHATFAVKVTSHLLP